MNRNVTYRQQYTRCGKQRCRKCQEGTGHGPYWYAYWRENGRTISKYLGVHAPPAEARRREQPIISTYKERIVQERETTAAASSRPTLASLNETYTAMELQTQVNAAPMPAGAQTYLRIYLLGQFRVEHKRGNKWQSVAGRVWRRQRARALLGCLLSQPGRCMGREQVMDALWPEADIEVAANRLNGAVHELRQILEPEIARPAASNLLRLEHDLLILADGPQIWVDAEVFEELLKRANTTTDSVMAERLLEEAASLYEGDYLPEDLSFAWAASRRESLRRAWIGLLLKLAELRTSRGALTSAIEPLDRLLTTDPSNETAVRRLMLLLTRLDRRGEAMRTYQRLVSLLKRDYGSDPLAETVELYRSLRQDQLKTSHPGTGPLSMAHLNPLQLERQNGLQSQPPAQEEHNLPDPPLPEQSAADLLALPLHLPRPYLPYGRPNQSPFVGRQQELETLRQVLLTIDKLSSRSEEKHKQNGEKLQHLSSLARFVIIRGEAGIGKTRLAEELSHAAQAHGWMVAWTRAYEQEGAIPYRPWTNILRSLLQDISLHQLVNLLEGNTDWQIGSSPGLIPSATALARLTRLSILLPELATHRELHLSQNHIWPPVVSEQDRFHLWEVVLFLLNTLGQSAPLLLVLDDLHWTDGSSLDLLVYLVRHLLPGQILLVGTYRDTELASDASLRLHLNDLHRERALETISLQPMTHAQIGSLVAYLPPEQVRNIQQQASGNPLFAEELARFSLQIPSENSNKEHPDRSHQSGSFDETGAGINRLTPLPDTIASVLERRLHKLSAACQSLLSKAAILGVSFELDLLLHMTGKAQTREEATFDLLEEALHSGFISEEASGPRIVYHFWHPLIVSHLYEQVSAVRRAQLHRRAGLALIELNASHEAEVAAAIAYHLAKSGQEKQKLVYYAELAGNQAMALSAYPEALHHYRPALDALRELHSTSPAQKHDTIHLANLLECLAECNTMLGNYPEARQQYIQALALYKAQSADSSAFADAEAYLQWQRDAAQIQGIIWRFLGRTWEITGDYSQAHTCVLRGKELLRAAGIADGVAWACLEHLAGSIYSDEGNFVEARRHVEASLAIHEEALRKIQSQALKADKSASEEYFYSPLLMTRSRRILQGNPLDLGLVREALGVIYSGMGLYSEALQHLYAAQMVYEEHDLIGAMGQCYSNIGAVHTMRAEYEIARVYFQRAMVVTQRTGDLPSRALITGNLGDIAWRCGDLQEAEALLLESLVLTEQITDRDGICWCLVTLGIVQRDQGNMRSALGNIRQALDLARGMHNTVRVGFALAALADWLISLALIRANREPTDPTMIATSASGNRLLRIAIKSAEQALALEGIDSETQGMGQAALTHIHLLLGNMDTAQQLALKTLEEARQKEAIQLIGRSQRLLGQIQAAQGSEQEAERYFELALQLFKQYGLRLEYARTLEAHRLAS